MKTKSIIFSGLLLTMVGAATTSCEDMFTKDSELYTTDMTPKDTIFQLMGIVNRIQSLADRSVILGEVRADLVDINSSTSTTIKQIANNDITVDNKYNKIADYYSVINACNIYIANVDTAYRVHNKQYYIREYAAAKVFRAWTYLQLVLNYEQVPFVTEPVLTAAASDDIVNSTSNRIDLAGVCDYFIEDIKPYVNIELPFSGSGTTQNGILLEKCFIPCRVMLGELYLWRATLNGSQADYINAAVQYHDYLDDPVGYKTVNNSYRTTWMDTKFTRPASSYSRAFFTSNASSRVSYDFVALIPLDTCAYDGTYSDLGDFYNSQFRNNYNVQVNPSQALKDISASQINCLYVVDATGKRDTLYAPTSGLDEELYYGDLRLNSIYNKKTVNDRYHAEYNPERQSIYKFASEEAAVVGDGRITYLPFYRLPIIYLHFAEALNNAGFPQAAMVVLKYGVSQSMFATKINSSELEKLQAIATTFDGNLASWNTTGFVTYDGVAADINQIGIHSLGCGYSEYNAYYTLPEDTVVFNNLVETDAELADSIDSLRIIYLNKEDVTWQDTVAFDAAAASMTAKVIAPKYYVSMKDTYVSTVRNYLLDELALEGMFEGYRFYDLMRESFRRNDPTYLAEKVACRKGKDAEDAALKAKLSSKSAWYLPIK